MGISSILDKLAEPRTFQIRQAAPQLDFCGLPLLIPILGDTNILCLGLVWDFHTLLRNSWTWPLVELGFCLVGLLDVSAILCLTDMVIDFDLFYFLLLTFSFLSMWFFFELNWCQNKWMRLKRVGLFCCFFDQTGQN